MLEGGQIGRGDISVWMSFEDYSGVGKKEMVMSQFV